VGATLFIERQYFFTLGPNAVARANFRRNPFPEAVRLATHIRLNSEPEDQVAVIGSEPQIYFYARRRAATAFIYTYPLMETHPFAHSMQQEMIAEIEAARPRFLVLVNVPTSWLARPGSSPAIIEWFREYAEKHYRVTGIADILSP